MAMIRQANLDSIARDPAKLNLGDLAKQGELLRTRAIAEAERIVKEARTQREALISGAREEGLKLGREQGYAEGFAKGAEAGKAKGHAEWVTRLDQLAKGWTLALDRFAAERDDMLLRGREDVLRLAVAIAQRVVKRVVAVDSGVAVAQVAAVLEMLGKPTRLRLLICPQDRAAIDAALPGLIARYAQAQHIELVDDGTLDRGSMVARLAGGEIDATIGTQLARLVEALVPADELVEVLAKDVSGEPVMGNMAASQGASIQASAQGAGVQPNAAGDERTGADGDSNPSGQAPGGGA